MTELEKHLHYISESLYSLEEEDILDYFEGVLEVYYITDQQKEYVGVILCLAWGGPSIYLDTKRKVLEGFWWLDHAVLNISSDIIKKIDTFWKEIYNS